MEFVQFIRPEWFGRQGAGHLVTEAVRGEGGVLRNKDGERFMERYDPEQDGLSTRDVVARAIYRKCARTWDRTWWAYLDISHKPAEYVKRKLPSMYHQFRELAMWDIRKDRWKSGLRATT